jgi:peroxin-7
MRFVSYETQDGLYDLAWSEVHENQLVTASGDGSIKLWDVMLNVSIRPNSDPLP